MLKELPNRDKWTGFVFLAWLVAVIVIGASIYLIVKLGTVQVGYYGTSPNIMVWAIGIGESILALLMAGLFTMVNSIYQNSCDQTALLQRQDEVKKIEPSPVGAPPSQSENPLLLQGLRIKAIHEGSPFYGVLSKGFSLHSINDIRLSTLEEAEAATNPGKNFAEVISPGGTLTKLNFRMKTDTLKIEIEE